MATDRRTRTQTLGVNFAPEVAAAIRRQGNRAASISAVLHSLIDKRKLRNLLERDRAR